MTFDYSKYNQNEKYTKETPTQSAKTEESFDVEKNIFLNSDEWNDLSEIESKQDRALGFLWKTDNYTLDLGNGIKIKSDDAEDLENIQIFENKETGEVVIIGADDVSISTNSDDIKLSIYDSDINEIKTGKGNDEIALFNSQVEELLSGSGIDDITIDGSNVGKIKTGAGADNINIKNSKSLKLNTNGGEDTVNIINSDIEKVKTGGGEDTVIATDSDINKLKTGAKSDSVSLNNTEVDKLKTNKKDIVVKDGNYMDFDKSKVANINSNVEIQLQDGSSIKVEDYVSSMLNKQVGFETEEEYQQYTLETLTNNLETMKSIFQNQNAKDGAIADGYNGLKDLTGLGISDEDIDSMIAKQEEMVNGLTAALNGESNMTFEEAYEYYTGTTYSQEKIDKYLEVSNTYSAVMTACQYDEEYIEKFEKATGTTFEQLTKEYGLCQVETFGKSTTLENLSELYSQDQEAFTEKLSATISTIGMACIVTGAAISFVFPPAAGVGVALMTAGKFIAPTGMLIDNALDLVDHSTDANGLTKDEAKDLAMETGVEVVSYAVGRGIGKATNLLNNNITRKAVEKGVSNLGSKVVGQAAETIADTALSLTADFAIAQGQSLITTGEFMEADDYWSMDRFLGEGKNQLIGILTGVASSKINAFQQATITGAQTKILSGDMDGAKTDLIKSGIKMTDAQFEEFTNQVKTIAAENKGQTLAVSTKETNTNTDTEIETKSVGGNTEETSKTTGSTETETKSVGNVTEEKSQGTDETEIKADGGKTEEKTNADTKQTQKINVPENPSKYQNLTIEEKQKLISNSFESEYLIKKFNNFSEERMTQVLDLKDIGFTDTEIVNTLNFNLNPKQFNNFKYLIESGYAWFDAGYITKIPTDKFELAVDLYKEGFSSMILKDIIDLKPEEYAKAQELLSLGKDGKLLLEYIKLEPESYSRVIDILKIGFSDFTDSYEIKRKLNLTDSEFEAEIEKMKKIKSSLEESNTPAEIKQIELSKEEKQELVNYLNKHNQKVSVDDSIEELSWAWVKVYRTSAYTPNQLNTKIEDAMIIMNKRYTMPETDTNTRSSTSLNRWMSIPDLESFIKSLPEEGEIYSPNRIQSYSTSKHLAETQFSDLSKLNNVKFVVYPANKTTSAFQIENKYNADCEVIYPSTQQFKVLYKGTEKYAEDFSGDITKGSHSLYTVYLQEIIPDNTNSTKNAETIEPTSTYLKPNIQLFAEGKTSTKSIEELLLEKVAGTKYESKFADENEFAEFVEVTNYVKNKLNNKNIKISDEYLLELVDRIGYSDPSTIVQSLSSITAINNFGQAIALNEFMKEGLITNAKLKEITSGFTQAGIFTFGFIDKFDLVLKEVGYEDYSDLIENLAEKYTESYISVEDFSYLMKNFDNENIRYISEKIQNDEIAIKNIKENLPNIKNMTTEEIDASCSRIQKEAYEDIKKVLYSEMKNFGNSEDEINESLKQFDKMFSLYPQEIILGIEEGIDLCKKINTIIQNSPNIKELLNNNQFDKKLLIMFGQSITDESIKIFDQNLSDAELCKTIDYYKIFELSMKFNLKENSEFVEMIKNGIDINSAENIIKNDLTRNQYNKFLSQGINNNYSAILANIKNIENYDIEKICNLMDSIKVTEDKVDTNIADALSKYLENNPNINITELTNYINKINFDKLAETIPNIKDFNSEQYLKFADYHYKDGGKTKFTEEDLTLTNDFTTYLMNNYINADQLTDLLTIYPATSRNVGQMPKGWLENIDVENQEKTIDNIYNAINNFQTHKDTKSFADEMSQILGKKVTVKNLGSGMFGTGYKITMDNSEAICLKLFDIESGNLYFKKDTPDYKNIHGQHIEVQTGLFVNNHSEDFVKMYFGKVAPYNTKDGFLVTQFLSDDTTPENTQPTNIDKYEIIAADAEEDHNMINGKIIDFGAISIDEK